MGIIEKKGKIGRTREEGRGGEGGMESESVRRERRMESAKGRVHLTSGRVRVHTQQFQFLVFFCAPTIHPIAPPWQFAAHYDDTVHKMSISYFCMCTAICVI